jgi:hypothetical protein
MSRPNDTFDIDLQVFSALMDERSVSRTAARLDRSRHAVDAALQRLRSLFGDPLLLKDRQHMVPTERALHLEASLRRVLGQPEKPTSGTCAPLPAPQADRLDPDAPAAPPLMTAVVDCMRDASPGLWLPSQRAVARRARPG